MMVNKVYCNECEYSHKEGVHLECRKNPPEMINGSSVWGRLPVSSLTADGDKDYCFCYSGKEKVMTLNEQIVAFTDIEDLDG